jgi:hypothetical protein
MSTPLPDPPPVVLATLLPSPGRKRSHSPYVYQLVYVNPNPEEAGCLMTWEVEGGRLVYQIAIERQANGRLRCHCTCADAVFRAEAEGRYCKHVRGFLAWGQPRQATDEAGPASMRLGA